MGAAEPSGEGSGHQYARLAHVGDRTEGKRYMFNYAPGVFRAQYAETEEEADRWYDDPPSTT